MSNYPLLHITLSEKIKKLNRPTEYPAFVLPYAQINDDKDNQIIHRANTIARDWKQAFGEGYGNDYAYGLHRVYSEAMNDENKLNKLTRNYIKNNFKDEKSFKCYYMNHKNAPKSSIDENF